MTLTQVSILPDCYKFSISRTCADDERDRDVWDKCRISGDYTTGSTMA